MKIVVLSFKRNFHNYENTAFINSALKHGVNLKLVDPDRCITKIENNKINIYYENKLLDDIDYVLVRVGCMVNKHVKHVIDAFEVNNTKVSISSDDAILFADKFSTHIKLASNNIDSINCMKVKKDIDYSNINYPCIFKSNTGSLGLGTYKINSYEELVNMIDHSKLLAKSYDYIIQDYVKDSFGKDLRVYVVNKKIVGVMQRESDGIDFRANYTLHNKGSIYEVDTKIETIVDSICKISNSDILGIDLLFTKNGYVVCEVNSAPGFKGFEDVHKKIKVSDLIIKTIKKELVNK